MDQHYKWKLFTYPICFSLNRLLFSCNWIVSVRKDSMDALKETNKIPQSVRMMNNPKPIKA